MYILHFRYDEIEGSATASISVSDLHDLRPGMSMPLSRSRRHVRG
jgi:hypothetical protein